MNKAKLRVEKREEILLEELKPMNNLNISPVH